MFIIITFDFADCFFRLNELHFSLSDYQQALEMDSSDWSVRCRLSIVHNEFGILEYYDRHYLEAIDHLTTSIQYNPRIGAYYLSRARARYMIEVTIMKDFWLNTFFVLFLRPLFATWRDEEAWLTARSEEQRVDSSVPFIDVSSQSNQKRRFSAFFETFSVTSIFWLLSRILKTVFFSRNSV